MNDREFATIASAIKAAWPNASIMPDKQSKEVWYTMLSDLDYPICLNAIKQLISTNIFPPSIAEIRQKCVYVKTAPLPDWGDAWRTVMKVMGEYGYTREDEAMEHLDSRAKAVIKRLGWTNICHSDNLVADRANFRTIYEAEAKKDMERNLLPDSVKAQQEKLRKLACSAVKAIESK